MKLLITIFAALVCCSVSAQSGSADTIYVDVPAEVEVLRLQTTECISVGKKDREKFGKKYPVLIFRREADIRKRIDSLLCEAGRKDQEVRAGWAKVATGNVAQEEVIEYALKMEYTDSINLVKVSHILDTYGWPTGLSEEANKAIFLVIDHSDLKTMNKYIGLFHSAVKKGYLPMNDLVTMEDRMLMNSGRSQKYGTQAYSVEENGQVVIYIWPVEEPDKLNELRKSVGLSPIENYLEIVKQQGVEIIFDKTKTVKDFK